MNGTTKIDFATYIAEHLHSLPPYREGMSLTWHVCCLEDGTVGLLCESVHVPGKGIPIGSWVTDPSGTNTERVWELLLNQNIDRCINGLDRLIARDRKGRPDV